MEELRWPEGVFPDVEPPKPGELTVIAAPRVSGKTTFAVELAKAWSREQKVVFCVPTIDALPIGLRHFPHLELFHIAVQRGSISDLYCDLASKFGRHGPDVLILDEVWLDPVPVAAPGGGERPSLKRLAQLLDIPVVAIVSRSVVVDAVLSADSLLVTDGRMPDTKELPDLGSRWFGKNCETREINLYTACSGCQ